METVLAKAVIAVMVDSQGELLTAVPRVLQLRQLLLHTLSMQQLVMMVHQIMRVMFRKKKLTPFLSGDF